MPAVTGKRDTFPSKSEAFPRAAPISFARPPIQKFDSIFAQLPRKLLYPAVPSISMVHGV
jgi:hypothetical protein